MDVLCKTGVAFFDEIRSEFPLPVRILITAYTDVEAVIDAINKGNIFRYVKKPWSNVDIMSCIEEANKFYIASSMLSIKNEELQKAYIFFNIGIRSLHCTSRSVAASHAHL